MRKNLIFMCLLYLMIIFTYTLISVNVNSLSQLSIGVEAGEFEAIKNNNSLIPILTYHKFSFVEEEWSSLVVSPEKFERDLIELKKAGFTTILPQDLVDFYNGTGDLPLKPLMITIDDGYLDNYLYAYPILKKLDMKAVIFVIGWCRGRYINYDGIPINHHFSWKEAKEMFESGLISIQPHSYNLHQLSDKSKGFMAGVERYINYGLEEYERLFRQDTEKIMQLINYEVGEEAIAYSYPFGIYNNTTEAILKDMGILVTFTTKKEIADIDYGLFGLGRINVPAALDSTQLVSKIEKMLIKQYSIKNFSEGPH